MHPAFPPWRRRVPGSPAVASHGAALPPPAEVWLCFPCFSAAVPPPPRSPPSCGRREPNSPGCPLPTSGARCLARPEGRGQTNPRPRPAPSSACPLATHTIGPRHRPAPSARAIGPRHRPAPSARVGGPSALPGVAFAPDHRLYRLAAFRPDPDTSGGVQDFPEVSRSCRRSRREASASPRSPCPCKSRRRSLE